MAAKDTEETEKPADHLAKTNASFEKGGIKGQTVLVVNWRLLTVSLLVLAMLGGVGFFRYRSVAQSTATSLLARADEFEQKKEWLGAASSINDYLAMRPNDIDAWYRFAIDFGQGATTFSQQYAATEHYLRVLGRLPKSATENRLEIYKRLSKTFLELGRWSEAEQIARDELGDTAERWRIEALAKYFKSTTGSQSDQDKLDVFTSLRKALDRTPGDEQLAEFAAFYCRQNLTDHDLPNRVKIADDVMDALINARKGETSNAPWLARYRYRRTFALTGAEEDLQTASRIAPDDVQVLIAMGNAKLINAQSTTDRSARQSELAEAELNFRRAQEFAIHDPEGYMGLAEVFLMQGKMSEACDILRSGLTKLGGRHLQIQRRLIEILLTKSDYAGAEHEINAFDETVRMAIRELPIDTRRERVLGMRGQVDLAKARLLIGQGKDEDAVRLLESLVVTQRVISGDISLVQDRVQTLALLAAMRAKAKLWRESAETYERLLELLPENATYQAQAAEAWKNAGNPTRMELHLRRMSARPNASEATLLALAQLELNRQLSATATDRQWTKFEALLTQITAAYPTSWRATLLDAGRWLGSSDPADREQALRLLKDAEPVGRNDKQFWELIATVYEQIGQPREADRALEAFQQLVGPGTESTLLKIRHLTRRGQWPEVQAAITATLPQSTDKSAERSLRLLSAMAHMRAGDFDAAREQYIAVHEADPKDASVICSLIELELQQQRPEAAESWEAKLRDVEGTSGNNWRYFRALRLMSVHPSGTSTDLGEAEQLQEELLASDPDNALWIALGGDLLARRGAWQQAAEAYEQATAKGDQRIATYEKLATLLYKSRRFADAESVLRKLKHNVGKSRLLSALAISVSDQVSEQVSGALSRAREVAQLRPDDVMAQIWLGHALTASDMHAEAESVFKKAVQTWPREISAWTALFSHYLGRADQQSAAAILKTFEAQTEIDPADRSLVLGQCYESLKDFDNARKHYRDAVAARPTATEPRMYLAKTLLQSDRSEAERQVRELLQATPSYAQGRRLLAAILAAKGGEEAWTEINTLLTETKDEQSGEPSIVDQRLRAVLLARQGNDIEREKSRSILESIVDSPESIPADRFLLAHVYREQNKAELALRQIDLVAASPTVTPAGLSDCIRFWIQSGDVGRAKAEMERLRSLTQASDIATKIQVIRLNSQLLHTNTQGENEAANWMKEQLNQLLQAASSDSDRERVLLAGADFFAKSASYAEAEKWLQKLVTIRESHFPALAEVMAKLGRHRDALAVVSKYHKSRTPVESVLAVASVLSVGTVPQDVEEKLEPLLKKTVIENSNNPDVLAAVGNVRTLQAKYQEAVGLLTKAAEIRPNDLAILNNLATVLAEDASSLPTALEKIEKAIQMGGELPPLLETKGTILYRIGRAGEAVTLLEAISKSNNVDPRCNLHLATALRQLGRDDEARLAYQHAVEAQLETLPLTKTDRDELAKLTLAF